MVIGNILNLLKMLSMKSLHLIGGIPWNLYTGASCETG